MFFLTTLASTYLWTIFLVVDAALVVDADLHVVDATLLRTTGRVPLRREVHVKQRVSGTDFCSD
jgi:hypothetical protein